jgi:4,5-dihydroxyphthalate decarboxylase
MPDLKLSLACGSYDRTRSLQDGRTKPEGIDLIYLPLPPAEIFWRMLRYSEFDISEMSLSTYLTHMCGNNPRFIAIPVFTSRMFRHGYIFINKNAGINSPQDLKGKRVGVPSYILTAIVWIKGMLQHEYGATPTDMEWYIGGKEGHGRIGTEEITLPKELHHEIVSPEHTLSDMLANRQIDALIQPMDPICLRNNHPDVRRLWPNYREVEIDYYKKTKIFPIMHTIAIRKELYESHPWVAQSMYKAFSQAKFICQDAIKLIRGSSPYILPWARIEYESTVSIMGEDFWPYGIDANRHTLEALIQYSYEQGLATRRLSLEEIFTASTQIIDARQIINK